MPHEYRYRTKAKGASEIIGPYTSMTAAALLGAGAGAAASEIWKNTDMHFNAWRGAIIGGGAALLANAIMRPIGKHTKTRSKAETQAYNDSGLDTVINYIVPGAASFNRQQSKRRKYDDSVIEEELGKTAADEAAADTPFTPVDTGVDPQSEEERETCEAPVVNTKRNALVGAGVGAAAGLLAFAVMRDRVPVKDEKLRKKRLWNKIWKSSLVGLGAGSAAFGLLSASDMIRGTNYSHKYRIPTKEKDGEHPDVVLYFGGSGGGGHTDNEKGETRGTNLDRLNTVLRYGDSKRVYLINPQDTYYAKDLIKKIKESVPGARIRIEGHSHGATSAYRIAQWAGEQGIDIDRLDTMDPIARFVDMSEKPKTVKRWNNYRLKDYPITGGGNFWALLGGLPGKLEGSEDHVFDPSQYRDHCEMRFVPSDEGDGTYSTDMPKRLRDAINTVYEVIDRLNKRKEKEKKHE